MIERARSSNPFAKGDRVYQRDRSGFRFGTILEAGSEQSGVRWDGSKNIDYEINRWMKPLIEGRHLWHWRFGVQCCYRCGSIFDKKRKITCGFIPTPLKGKFK